MSAADSAGNLSGENMCLPALRMAAVEEAPKKWCLALSDELVREGNRSVLKDEPAECRKLGFGAVFDVTTGELISPPAPLGVAIYPVRIAGDDVEVEI